MNTEKAKEIINSTLCPLCAKSNACNNVSDKTDSGGCWCHDPSIKFPSELFAMVPAQKQGKACICKACVLKYYEVLNKK